jgi:hypothetical protein
VGLSERFTPPLMPKLNCAAAGIDAKRQRNANNPKNLFMTEYIYH